MRDCGDCIVCCVYLRIDDLSKPGMTHCKNLTLPGPEVKDEVFYTGGKGCTNCTIYDSRPTVCATYQCSWLQGHGNEEDRPDKSLMLFDHSKGIENAVEAKPLAEGAEITSRATIDRVSKSMGLPVIVLNFYERRIMRVVGRGV